MLKLVNPKTLFSEITEIPPVLDQKKYPSLNGLRGISIIMVIVHHFILLYSINFINLAYIGPLGVNIFFVISGFLITTLCIKEKALTGDLSLKTFYLRRIFRILPVAYLYILIVAILNYVFKLHIAALNFVAAILFIADLSFFRRIKFDWDLAHYWSLSVEEQFYLIFPVFIKKKFSLFVLLILIVAFCPPIFFWLQVNIGSLNNGIFASFTRFLSKFQGIAIGCLFSVLLFKGYLNFGKLSLIITLVSIFMIFYIKFDPFESLSSTFFNLLISIFTGLIIVNNIHPQQTNLIYKFLNLKLLNFIGILSYSLYIWQQLFLSNDPRFPLSKYPVNLIFVVLVPIVSYFVYERYFLRLKSRFKKVQ